jgi:hypothetical protein
MTYYIMYDIYYVVRNIEYIENTTFVSTIVARTPPRMLSKRMLVLKVSRAPPRMLNKRMIVQLQADRGHTSLQAVLFAKYTGPRSCYMYVTYF